MTLFTDELKSLKIVIGLPTYDGRRHNGMMLWSLRDTLPAAMPIEGGGSLLAKVFNDIFVKALKARDKNEATHFLLLHEDIVPASDDWFAVLWNEFRRVDAEMMAAVVPLKDPRGLTSTAVEEPKETGLSVRSDSDLEMNRRRLSLKECDAMGGTFTHPGLLLNSGMLLFDLRHSWVNSCHFTINDEITWHAGEPVVSCSSEDWNFTRMARDAGAERIYATNKVRLLHVGKQHFPSWGAWGIDKDPGW